MVLSAVRNGVGTCHLTNTMDMQKRNAKIHDMRKAHMTLLEIGQHFGITKERVRQILGPSKRYPRLYDLAWMTYQKERRRADSDIAREIGCHPQTVERRRAAMGLVVNVPWDDERVFRELKAIAETGQVITAGVMRSLGKSALRQQVEKNRDGYTYWRKRLGQTLPPDRSVARGWVFQHEARRVLESLGHEVAMMPWRHPFDILLDKNLEIEVKGSKKRSAGYFSFNLWGPSGHSLTADYLLAGCEEEHDSIVWFIIPTSALNGRTQLCISSINSPMWQHCREAWEQLGIGT